MARTDVAIVTHAAAPDVDADDIPLVRALDSLGVTWRALAWDDPRADWAACSLAVLRSAWDYHLRRDAYLAWAGAVERVVPLHNPAAVIRANTHKRYLLELARRGAPVVATELVEQGSGVTLREVAAGRDWSEVVFKPAVSAGSWRTHRARADDVEAGRLFLELVAERDVLVQPWLASVGERGERCLVYVGGAYSHSVRKRARFAAEAGHEPGVVAVEPRVDERALAERVLAAADATGLLYARVDIADGPAVADGPPAPLLMELELTEPRLYLRTAPAEAATRLAQAIAARLS